MYVVAITTHHDVRVRSTTSHHGSVPSELSETCWCLDESRTRKTQENQQQDCRRRVGLVAHRNALTLLLCFKLFQLIGKNVIIRL